MKGFIECVLGVLFGIIFDGFFMIALGLNYWWIKATIVIAIIAVVALVNKFDEEGKDISILRLLFDKDYYID